MWSKRFSTTIRRFVRGALPQPLDFEELRRLDTSRIYVENVRALLGVSHKAAQDICDVAWFVSSCS